jgi:hypothetical protein
MKTVPHKTPISGVVNGSVDPRVAETPTDRNRCAVHLAPKDAGGRRDRSRRLDDVLVLCDLKECPGGPRRDERRYT